MTVKASAIPWVTSINSNTDNRNSENGNSSPDATGVDRESAEARESAEVADRWTVQRLLNWTTDYFREHGSDEARLDAEILLAEAMECQRIELYTRFNEEPTEDARLSFRGWVARHADGEPVAYLVGHREFFSVKFYVDSNVLIPRPETEHLVTEALDAIAAMESGDTGQSAVEPIRVVDVGTGSGNVAVTLRKHAANIQLTACDVSEAALAVARKNARMHDVDEGIAFVTSDLLTGVTEPEQFDLIVSNPPYIGLSEKSDLDKSVVEFEPHQALFASGPDGTETIVQLVQQSVERLKPGGLLLFEISPMIAEACQQIVETTSGFEFVRFVNDLAGLRRIVVAKRSGM